jgi:hypothetical protein
VIVLYIRIGWGGGGGGASIGFARVGVTEALVLSNESNLKLNPENSEDQKGW